MHPDRNEFLQVMHSKLALWETEYEFLKDKARRKTGQARKAITNRIDELTEKSRQAKEKLRAASSTAEGSWDVLRNDLERLWDDLKLETALVRESMSETTTATPNK